MAGGYAREVESTARGMRDITRNGKPIFTVPPEQVGLDGAITPAWAGAALDLSPEAIRKLEEEINGITKTPDNSG